VTVVSKPTLFFHDSIVSQATKQGQRKRTMGVTYQTHFDDLFFEQIVNPDLQKEKIEAAVRDILNKNDNQPCVLCDVVTEIATQMRCHYFYVERLIGELTCVEISTVAGVKMIQISAVADVKMIKLRVPKIWHKAHYQLIADVVIFNLFMHQQVLSLPLKRVIDELVHELHCTASQGYFLLRVSTCCSITGDVRRGKKVTCNTIISG
jgi:hypothetical protein